MSSFARDCGSFFRPFGPLCGLAKPLHQRLSQRELQVFLRLAPRESVGCIATHIALSVKTVSTYRTRIMEKLNLASKSDLTYYALKNGLIQ